MTDLPTADRTSSEAGTTAEQATAPFSLAPVPGLQALGGDAVGFCGPDGCYPAGADAGSTDIDGQADPAPPVDGRPAHAAPTDRVP